MDIGNVGQYVQLLEGIQQLWHNPQLQQLYHLHAIQRNHTAQQLGPCPLDSQPLLPPPFNHTFLTHPSPPPTLAFEHPSAATSSHMQHLEHHRLLSSPQGHHPPVVRHPQGDSQYSPPSNFFHDPGQHSSSPSCHTAPDRETHGPE